MWLISHYSAVAVPNVVGISIADANSAIIDAGLVVGDINQQCSDTVAAGYVISQNPVGGTTASPGSSINLVVSTGQPLVPDVTGMTEAAAIATIKRCSLYKLWFKLNSVQRYSTGRQCNKPVCYWQMLCGTVVNLVISTVSVPDVTGQTEAAAIAAINAVANISYGSSSTACNDTVPGRQRDKPVATGTCPRGTVVNLVVSTGRPLVPDVTGMRETAAIATINAVPYISYGSSSTACQPYSTGRQCNKPVCHELSMNMH